MVASYPILRSRRSPPRIGAGRDITTPLAGRFQLTISSFSTISALFPIETQADFFVAPAPLGNDNNNGQTEATPWATIGKVNNPFPTVIVPGDIIAFERGGVYGDAELRPATSGFAGNPITYTAYGIGGNKPELGSINLRRIVIIDNGIDFITIEDLHLRKSDQAAPSKGLVTVNGRNFIWKNVDLTGEGAGPVGVSGMWLTVGAVDFLVDGGTIEDVGSASIDVEGGPSNGTIKNIFFGTHSQAGPAPGSSGEGLATEASTFGGPWFVENCIFDATADLTRGEQNFDTKGTGVWTVTNCLFLGARQGAIINQHSAIVTYNTCVFNPLQGGTPSRSINLGIPRVPSQGEPTVTFNFCTFIMPQDYVDFIRINDPIAVTFNSCGFIVPAGSSVDRIIEMTVGLAGGGNGNVKLFNCTLVNRGALIELINMRDTFDGSIEIANTILDSDEADLLFDFNGNTAVTLNKNLYFHPAGGTWGRSGGVNYTEITLIDTLDTSGSDTGDPDFATEDPDAADFFKLNIGSLALDLGDPADAPEFDLKGIAYDLVTPNAGCRAGDGI